MVLSISILGASGKMGQQIIKLAKSDPHYKIVCGLVRPDGNPRFFSFIADKLAIPLKTTAEEAMDGCEVAIDFSSAQITKEHIKTAHALKKGLVIGTTGLDKNVLRAMKLAAQEIPILYSPNFSLGMALCLEAVNKFASSLFGDCYIDIFETHHIHKKDSPSGTALALAKAIGKGTVAFNQSDSNRNKEQIVIHSIRSGDVLGEHTIIFECGNERIQLTHQAHSRDAFAKGALLAATFLVEQPPGLYSIKDLFKHG